MDIEHYRELFAYDAWANQRVRTCLDDVSEGEFAYDLGYSVGSLRMQMVHTMTNQAFWIRFLTTGAVRFHDYDDFPTRQSIWDRWEQVDLDTRRYLEGLSAEGLNEVVLPPHWAERGRTPFTVLQGLAQIINHNTDHGPRRWRGCIGSVVRLSPRTTSPCSAPTPDGRVGHATSMTILPKTSDDACARYASFASSKRKHRSISGLLDARR